jgi:hypothetical protein
MAFFGEVRIKNLREWIYPESEEIWSAISKCCELDAVPVLITRKLPYVSFLFFGRAGMVGYQTHFQYFDPATEPELSRVKAVDGLGYKDIHCTLEPNEHIIRFFGKTLPKISAEFQARFKKNKQILKHFADDERLRDGNLNPQIRHSVFAKAWKAVVGNELTDDLLI